MESEPDEDKQPKKRSHRSKVFKQCENPQENKDNIESGSEDTAIETAAINEPYSDSQEISTEAETAVTGEETKAISKETQSEFTNTVTETNSEETATETKSTDTEKEIDFDNLSNNGEKAQEKRKCAVANGASCSKLKNPLMA